MSSSFKNTFEPTMISKSYRELPPVTASLLNNNNNNNSSATSSTSKFPLKTRYQAIDIGS